MAEIAHSRRKYTHGTVAVEALRLTPDTIAEATTWLVNAGHVVEGGVLASPAYLKLGEHTIREGEWLCQLPDGRFGFMKDSRFVTFVTPVVDDSDRP